MASRKYSRQIPRDCQGYNVPIEAVVHCVRHTFEIQPLSAVSAETHQPLIDIASFENQQINAHALQSISFIEMLMF